MEYRLINKYVLPVICSDILAFSAAIILVEYILLFLIVMVQLQIIAIQMPFFRNGGNCLDFQKKSDRLKSQPFYSLAKNTTMCYVIVTKWHHSLSVFAKEGIVLEF
jgi:hypothetical protein